MSSPAESFYARRIEAVLRYIGANLDQDLSLDALSEVAGFSKFHFHRQFRVYTGIPVAKLVALLRLKRASLQLALHDTDSVIEIALEAGFGGPEAFARAFRRALGQSPSQFRTHPDWERWAETFRSSPAQPQREHPMESPLDVEIVLFPTTRIAVLEHEGPPETIMRSVGQFIEWRKSCAVSPEATSETYGVPFSDPAMTPGAEFRFDICGSTTQDVLPNAFGVQAKELPGNRCARARHLGSTDRISETVHRLYGEWLPESGEEAGDFPCFFHYIARMPRVSELEQITDVYLPLAKP